MPCFGLFFWCSLAKISAGGFARVSAHTDTALGLYGLSEKIHGPLIQLEARNRLKFPVFGHEHQVFEGMPQ